MKKLLFVLLAVIGLASQTATAQILVGSGTDSSFLVIEATAFGSPLVYQYQYDYDPGNPLTTTDLMIAVDSAIADISFELLYGGAFLNSITYQSTTLVNSSTPPDYSPFWAQWVSGGESGDPLAAMPAGVWIAGFGPANRTLAPDSWDGFIFNGTYDSNPPYDVTSPPPSVNPVPEPTVTGLLVVSVSVLLLRRRRHAPAQI